MKKAAIAIDSWKLEIFEKHLKAAEYEYSVNPCLTEDMLILQVSFEFITHLHPIVKAANHECAMKRMN